MTSLPLIRVAAAVIERRGRFLLARRPAGGHMAGYWEFPGGKLEDGETPESALVRELREELGVAVAPPRPFAVLRHDYPDRRVELHFLRTSIVDGQPRPLEVAEIGWFEPARMPELPILPADLPLVERLARPAEEAR
ncbi:MAG: 8-oxo-dGTP diphosphatase MutT [Acidobacteriota bacterium]